MSDNRITVSFSGYTLTLTRSYPTNGPAVTRSWALRLRLADRLHRQAVDRPCPRIVLDRGPCGLPAEEGEGNPDDYCTRHLDEAAGEQEAWESDDEYDRRRLSLCPYQLGSGMPGLLWCPEPSDRDNNEAGWCVVHNPVYDPGSPEFDPPAAAAAADESVLCLQCSGNAGCGMCAGVGRISLRTANFYRSGSRLVEGADDADPT